MDQATLHTSMGDQAVGAKVTRYKPGDAVIAAAGTGAFCERIAANENGVYPIPGGLSFEQAMQMMPMRV